MTIKELIKKLSQYDQDLEVVCSYNDEPYEPNPSVQENDESSYLTNQYKYKTTNLPFIML